MIILTSGQGVIPIKSGWVARSNRIPEEDRDELLNGQRERKIAPK